ncbi:putative thioesterase [Actinosynnema pretiosum subsp. pretiosum]|nr:putative thioesterase [Actinosynnema pretiosum subsp. pretiosum]
MDVLPEDADLALVCYPGREGRYSEQFARDWGELAVDATSAVLSAADRPYVLFGHSMGGWMAFHVAARIEQAGGPTPEAVVVSSCNPPRPDGVSASDMVPAAADSDEELIGWMGRAGLLPDYALGDPALREMAVDLMRADIRVRDTQRIEAGTTVGVPLQVLHGETDDAVDPDAAGGWRALSRTACRVDRLPGGHFYTPEVWASLPTRFASLRGAVTPSTPDRRGSA